MLEKILVITNFESTIEKFNEDFSDSYTISYAINEVDAIANFSKDFFDYIFIDLDYIKNYQKIHLTKERFNQIVSPLQQNFLFSKKIIMANREDTQDCN